jgi:hypothetical protein
VTIYGLWRRCASHDGAAGAVNTTVQEWAMPDFLPRADKDLLPWARNFQQILADSHAQWGLPPAQVAQLVTGVCGVCGGVRADERAVVANADGGR